MSKRERFEDITLESSDGTQFHLNLEDAKKSKTICNLIEDIGIDRPIPIIAIPNDILQFIVRMLSGELFSGLEYSIVIQIFLAANYLDIEFILKSVADNIKQIYLKHEKYDSDFNGDELKLICEPKMHLKNIRICSLRKSPGNFCLLDVPRDVIAKYIFPKLDFNEDWWTVSYNLEKLFTFRCIHRYFWHVTTQYIVDQARHLFDSSFSDEQIFDCICMYSRDHPIKLSRFGLTKKDLLPKTLDDIGLMDMIIIGFKKHGSVERMNEIAEKKQSSALKAKETRRSNQEKFEQFADQNNLIVEKYMDSLGYLKYCDYHIPRLTYLIVDPEVDEHVQVIKERLRNYTRIILEQVPLDLNYLKKFLKHEKIVEVLTSTVLYFDNFEEEEEDVVTLNETFQFKTLDQFYDLLKMYQKDMLGIMAQVFLIKEELEKIGLHFSKQEILYYGLDKQTMIDVITNSSDLNFIYRHTRSKAKFISILKKENI